MKLDCKHVWGHISEYIDKTVDAKLRRGYRAPLGTLRNLLGDTGFDAEHSCLTADDRTFECRWATASGCTSGWRKSLRVPRRIPRKNEEGYSGLALRDTVNQRVSDPFGSEEKQGQDRESDLRTLGVEFFFSSEVADATVTRGGLRRRRTFPIT